jgi:hypothetical protein
MEILYALGFIKHFATNVKIYESPFHIEPIIDLWSLKKWCRDTQGPKLMVIDEIGRTVGRRTPMARLNVGIINELQIIRKYKLSVEIVTVDEKYTDNAILGSDVLDGFFTKPDYKHPEVALYQDSLEHFSSEIYDIPKTVINFDTWDSAPFTEKPLKHKPTIKDADTSTLWDWSHGATYKQLGTHPQALNRIVRKYVKDKLESDFHISQD